MLKKSVKWVAKNLVPISLFLSILASLWIILGIKPVFQWGWRDMLHKYLGGNDLLMVILAVYAIINAFQMVKVKGGLESLIVKVDSGLKSLNDSIMVKVDSGLESLDNSVKFVVREIIPNEIIKLREDMVKPEIASLRKDIMGTIGVTKDIVNNLSKQKRENTVNLTKLWEHIGALEDFTEFHKNKVINEKKDEKAPNP